MIFRRWGGATQPVGSFRSRRPSESEARSPGAPWFGLYRQLFGGGGKVGLILKGGEGVGLGEFLVFVAQGVVGARSGSFGSYCDRDTNRCVQFSPDHSLDPAKKGEKEGGEGRNRCPGVLLPGALS